MQQVVQYIGGAMWQLFHPESQQPPFPSPSISIYQAWSHSWTYLLNWKIGTHGGSNSTQDD